MTLLIISILLLGIIMHLLWKQHLEFKRIRVQATRQALFNVRSELFVYAAEGNVSFNNHAYGMTRTVLNGYIRYAHEITLMRMLLIFIKIKKANNHEYTPISHGLLENIKGLDKNNKFFFYKIIISAHTLILMQVVENSIVLRSLFWLLKQFAKGQKIISKNKKRMQKSSVVNVLDIIAKLEGQDQIKAC